MQTFEVDREIFHQMMRQLAGGTFRGEPMSANAINEMHLVAEKLAHATAIKQNGATVEVVVP